MYATEAKRIKKILISLVILVASVSFLTGAMFAMFMDVESSPDNVFSAGTLALGTNPATAMFTVSGMLPGDVEYSGIEVSNNGTLSLRYAMTTTADNTSTLDEQLVLTIDVVTSAGNDTIWYTSDDVVGEANIYGPDGVLSSAAIGDPTRGADPGDRILASLSSERLRFKVTLPLSTDDTYQNTNCTVSFVFYAE